MIETVPSGTVLHGRYRIERVLGSGGFGHVYLALDLANGQQCAVKEYLVTGASGQEQLKHEATVLSQLHHPSLPAFQDAFIERGRYYVVLNYIEGSDLTDLVRVARQRNEVIPISQIVSWLLAICDAVMFLHSQRPIVIHRDIKPDNIRITPNGTAVLVDLGNAKAAADGARTLFFIRHQGTPGYAPPEQYPGGSGTDARSDIYALGGTLYFALTASEPPSVSVRNQSAQQGQPTLPSLQEQLANNPPEGVPENDPTRQFRLGVTKPGKPAPRHSRHIAQMGTLPPKVLNQLNIIIQKSMALKPKDRYQYVADLANDLKQILRVLPPPPTPPTPSRDLHATQPDLAELYDTLQAAKEQQQKGPQAAGTIDKTRNTPGMPPTPMPSQKPHAVPGQPAASSQCPHCGAGLTPMATFCPRCGTVFRAATNQATKMHQESASAPVQPGQQAQGGGSGDETLLMKRDQFKQQIAASRMNALGEHQASTQSGDQVQPGTPRPFMNAIAPGSSNAGSTATAEQVIPQKLSQSWQQVQVSTFPAGNTQNQATSSPSTPVVPQQKKPDLRIFILIGVALLVIIVVIVLFLTIKHASAAQAQLHALWLATQTDLQETTAACFLLW